jgi:hypothetical protein
MPNNLATVQRVHEKITLSDGSISYGVLGLNAYYLDTGGGPPQLGDLVCLILQNSSCPNWTLFSKLANDKFIVKPKTFDGILQRGLVISLNSILYATGISRFNEGDNLTDSLGLSYYEQEYFDGQLKNIPPILSVTSSLNKPIGFETLPTIDILFEGHDLYVTEWLDGVRITVWDDGMLPIKIAIEEKKITKDNSVYPQIIQVLEESGVLSLVSHERMFKGVLVGPGVHHNPYQLKKLEVYWYDIVLYASTTVYDKSIKFNYMAQNKLTPVPLIRDCIKIEKGFRPGHHLQFSYINGSIPCKGGIYRSTHFTPTVLLGGDLIFSSRSASYMRMVEKIC